MIYIPEELEELLKEVVTYDPKEEQEYKEEFLYIEDFLYDREEEVIENDNSSWKIEITL